MYQQAADSAAVWMERQPPEFHWTSKAWHCRSRPESILPPSVSHLFTTSKSKAVQQIILEKNLEEIMSGLRSKLDSGKWETADSEVLIQLLETGWHSNTNASAKASTRRRDTIERPEPCTPPTRLTSKETVSQTNGGVSPLERRRSFHIDLSQGNMHRQEAAGPWYDENPNPQSPMGEGCFSEMTTPRSWVTAVSVLPTSLEDLEGLGEDDIRHLIAEATEIQERAQTALTLAQSRLPHNNANPTMKTPLFALVGSIQASLQAYLQVLPLYALLIPSTTAMVPKWLIPLAYSTAGAFVGIVEGVFTRLPWK